jgi:hypothetical protein
MHGRLILENKYIGFPVMPFHVSTRFSDETRETI